MDTPGKSKTSKKDRSIRETGAGKGEAPRTGSTNNSRPPGASPTPTGAAGGGKKLIVAQKTDNQKLADYTKNHYKKD